jgi:hypothetical protein
MDHHGGITLNECNDLCVGPEWNKGFDHGQGRTDGANLCYGLITSLVGVDLFQSCRARPSGNVASTARPQRWSHNR